MKKKSMPRWVYQLKSKLEVSGVFRRIRLPRTVLDGIVAVIFMYVGVAGIFSIATPWDVSGDTRQHIDYVWQLYNGDLPRRSEGLKYPPVIELYGGFKLQSASANPPVFYILQAPFIGPLLNDNNYQQAVLVGRAVNVVFGVLCVIALAWAGWVFGGRRRELFAIAVPALSVLTYRFVRLNLDFALDALLVLLFTLAIILTYKILLNGLQKKFLIPLVILSVLGMATKAPYIVVLLISLLGVGVSSLIHGNKTFIKNALKGALIALVVLVIVGAAIGWFYYNYNFLAYGNWISAREPGYTGGREVRTLMDVITSPSLWGLFYTDLVKQPYLSIAITCVALAGFFTLRARQVRDFITAKRTWFILPLLALVLLGVFATNIEHATGVGAINFRYMLPAILPISLFLAFGLLAFQRVRGLLVVFAVVSMGVASLLVKKSVGVLEPTAMNGIPSIFIFMFLGLFGLGSILFLVTMLKLTKPKPEANSAK